MGVKKKHANRFSQSFMFYSDDPLSLVSEIFLPNSLSLMKPEMMSACSSMSISDVSKRQPSFIARGMPTSPTSYMRGSNSTEKGTQVRAS